MSIYQQNKYKFLNQNTTIFKQAPKTNLNQTSSHILDSSPWPFIASFGCLFLTLGTAMYFHNYSGSLFLTLLGLIVIIATIFFWLRDVVREGVYEGQHTKLVQIGLMLGMLLFMFSEVMLFFGFFWAFFHSALSPVPEIGSIWPPLGIETINPWGVPLLNTIILLTSGATITSADNAIVSKNIEHALIYLKLTIVLALLFTFIQALEYRDSTFCISDGVYSALFFLLTLFHGFHVIVGTIFIIVNTLRLINSHFVQDHHVGLTAGALYWHLVDFVWIGLFIAVYWWGGSNLSF